MLYPPTSKNNMNSKIIGRLSPAAAPVVPELSLVQQLKLALATAAHQRNRLAAVCRDQLDILACTGQSVLFKTDVEKYLALEVEEALDLYEDAHKDIQRLLALQETEERSTSKHS